MTHMHGFFMERKHLLLLAFHVHGDDTRLCAKLFYPIPHTFGMWRDTSQQIFLCSPCMTLPPAEATVDQILVKHATQHRDRHFEADSTHVQCAFLWLHPGKDQQMMICFKDNRTIIWAMMKNDVWYTNILSGSWEYNADSDMWYTYFHSDGPKGAAFRDRATHFRRVPNNFSSDLKDKLPIWRACGGTSKHREQENLDLQGRYQELERWHTCIVRLL